MKLSELKQKAVWQMTGDELLQLIYFGLSESKFHRNKENSKTNPQEQNYVYGLKGIAKLFGCSVSSAQRLKKSGKIDDAIIQDGRKIIVEVDKVLELVRNHKIPTDNSLNFWS